MGIRFYCPKGHKLNVKEFQAGLKGICPYCGARMEIPLTSTRPSSKQRGTRGARQSVAVGFQAGTVESSVGPAQPEAAATAENGSEDEELLAVLSMLPSAQPSVSDQGANGDQLTEAGDAVWYVRPPSGGQYGPAVADVMRTWLAEGRISGDTYVWREGWPDWREADKVFGELSFGRTFPEFDPVAVAPNAGAPVSPAKKSTVPSPKTQFWIVGILALVVFILFIIFLAVRLSP